MDDRTCSQEGCAAEFFARGLCRRHYLMARNRGEFECRHPARSVKDLLRGRTHAEGSCVIWDGRVNDHGYGVASFHNHFSRVHRVVWEEEHGPVPAGAVIDHLCFRRSCVNVEHMRLLTNTQNVRRRSGANSNSTSGVRNVSKIRGRWAVVVKKDRKARHFGSYDTIAEAAAVAERARHELFGDFAGNG